MACLVVSAPAWDRTGCEFDSSNQINLAVSDIYPMFIEPTRLLGFLRGSPGSYGLTQKLCLKKKSGECSHTLYVASTCRPKLIRRRVVATRAFS